MRKLLPLFFTLIITISFGQTGSSGDPFTALGQALGVPVAGIYYFNLGGTTFNTYVDASGYVQVAIDFGNGIGDLPQGTSLSASSRGILNATVLASLGSITHVRISTSTGNFNVVSSNATIISRLKTNYTLHRGAADNIINDSWSGTNSNYITMDASGCTNTIVNLHQNIVHVCGNGNGFHWVQTSNAQSVSLSGGDIADAASMHLWVKDANYVLPLQQLNFNTVLTDNKYVELFWKTSSETNHSFFAVERSQDGKDWEEIEKINGAGNSSQLISYSAIDTKPLSGVSYYRLKQTDFNGEYTYSKTNTILFDTDQSVQIFLYPNPTSAYVTIQGNETEIASVKIYNALGDEVTDFAQVLSKSGSSVVFDLSNLVSGIYSIKTLTGFNRIYKE
jgi:hypothetical protein